jgi:hypothetical protein
MVEMRTARPIFGTPRGTRAVIGNTTFTTDVSPWTMSSVSVSWLSFPVEKSSDFSMGSGVSFSMKGMRMPLLVTNATVSARIMPRLSPVLVANARLGW